MSEPTETGTQTDRRKLVAVVYADMVGYSRLIGLDDAGTLKRLRALRANLIDPAIEEHCGKIVQTGGDSLLIVFDSIDGAVRCAVKVQQEVPTHDADHPLDRAIRFRVGINIGDAIADGTDLHGDAVNVAVRLQAECPPGGICVSRSVRDHVHGRLDLAFEALGALSLKNIARPVEAYVIPNPDSALKRMDSPKILRLGEGLPLPEKPSIAVLPFINLSGDPEQEYFSDGVVEDIITALSRTGWLFVIARNSSFIYKGKSPDIRSVGHDLGVRYVLRGSIRRAEERIRLTCQLIDAFSGNHVWADRFDGSLIDIFELQDRITECVIGAVEPNLQRFEIMRAITKRAENLDAYDLYLRALQLSYSMSKPKLEAGTTLLRRSLEIEPSYARAKAFLTWVLTLRSSLGWDIPGQIGEAMTLARETLASGTDDPDALRCAAWALSFGEHDHSAALTALNRALRLHPYSAQVLYSLGYVHCRAFDPEPAIPYFERAMRLSPLDPEMGYMKCGIGLAHLELGRAEVALPFLQQAVQEAPYFTPSHRHLILALVRLERLDEARAAARRLLELRPDYRHGSSHTGITNEAFLAETRRALSISGIPE